MFDLRDLGLLISDHIPGTWYFPQAPYELNIGSYAWFPSDEREMQQALSGNFWQNLEDLSSDYVEIASEQILQFIEQEQIDMSKTVLAGFSQGSMVSLACSLKSSVKPLALGLFSSNLLSKKWILSQINKLSDLDIFQCHGTFDPILPLIGAHNLRDILTTKTNLQYLEFPGVHEIPYQSIEAFISFLKQTIDKD